MEGMIKVKLIQQGKEKDYCFSVLHTYFSVRRPSGQSVYWHVNLTSATETYILGLDPFYF